MPAYQHSEHLGLEVEVTTERGMVTRSPRQLDLRRGLTIGPSRPKPRRSRSAPSRPSRTAPVPASGPGRAPAWFGDPRLDDPTWVDPPPHVTINTSSDPQPARSSSDAITSPGLGSRLDHRGGRGGGHISRTAGAGDRGSRAGQGRRGGRRQDPRARDGRPRGDRVRPGWQVGHLPEGRIRQPEPRSVAGEGGRRLGAGDRPAAGFGRHRRQRIARGSPPPRAPAPPRNRDHPGGSGQARRRGRDPARR